MGAGPAESLSIVMAAFNEEEALARCAERTLDFLRQHVQSGELVIVDDGSTDGTWKVIEDLSEREPRVVGRRLRQNSGMGAALLEGYGVAKEEWITMLPGDGQLDAFELLHFFEAARNADLVTSLYRNRQYPLGRKVLSLGLRLLTALIVGTRARTEGTYMVRSDVLRELGPRSHSFLLNLEIPIRAKRGGYRVETVYMNVQERLGGESKAATPHRVWRTFADHFSLRASLERDRLQRIFEHALK